MPSSPAKALLVCLSSALRAGFSERGWRTKTVRFSVDVPPSGWVQAPLELMVAREVAPAKYGGVSLSASATIWSPQVSEVMKVLPPGCFDEVTERAFHEKRALARLAHVDFDALKSSSWTAIEETELDAEASRFFDVLDGPVRQWATDRATPERLLSVQATSGAPETQQPANVRTMIILAVQEGLVDVARGLVSGYVPAGRSDTEERFASFEVELAKWLPAYGAPARPDQQLDPTTLAADGAVGR